MEIYVAAIIAVLIYVYLKNDNKKNKFKEAQRVIGDRPRFPILDQSNWSISALVLTS